MASTVEFFIPDRISEWVELRDSHKLNESTLSGLGNIQSGLRIKDKARAIHTTSRTVVGSEKRGRVYVR